METHEKDYFIPNFGVDKDIIDTNESLKTATKNPSYAQYWKA